MAEIQLVDVSLRDGNQSLWSATGLNSAQMLQIAPVIDRIGFKAIDFSSSTHMGMGVRTFADNPWERFRLMRDAMPNTPMQFIGTGFRFYSWETQHPEFMQLVYDRLVECGVTRFVVLDPMHDEDALMTSAAQLRKAGATDVMGALTFTLSDVHDDVYYADLAAKMAASPNFDTVYLKDPSGLLTPQRASTLIPALKQRMQGKPLEIHSHTTIGLGAISSLEAAGLGVTAVHVATGPLSNGSSLPDAQRMVSNLREFGHSVDIDEFALTQYADYMRQLARAEGLPFGQPQDFDAAFFRHQVAGGVMSTTRRQLRELGLEHRFDDVMAEVPRVRAELGYPIVVTPFAQMLCTQAMYNVIQPERYQTVPDQVTRYVLGKFGRATAPIDPNVMDRIMTLPSASDITREPPPQPLAETRRKFSPRLSDEEFLLRAVMPAEQVDAMVAKGPARRRYNPWATPIVKLVEGLGQRPALRELQIQKSGLDIRLESSGENAHVVN